MHADEEMAGDLWATVERLDRSRRAALTGFVVGYLLWQVTVLADEFGRAHLSEAVLGRLFEVALTFAVVCACFGLRYAVVARRIASQPRVAEALNDERVRRSLATAYSVGFWSLGVYLIVARLLAFGVDLSGSLVAQAGIVVGLAGTIVGFLVLERG